MENKNFYSVAIGKMAKSGNLVKQFDFVCASEKKWIDVRNHYIQKYQGFDVDIKNVELIDEPKIVSNDSVFNPESSEVSRLKKELAELKSSKSKSSFIIEVRGDSLTGEARELYKKLKEEREKVSDTEEELKKQIEKDLKEKYGIFCSSACLQDVFKKATWKTECEIHLNGKLSEL